MEFDNNNVCKFNLNRSSDLICLNFIREKKESQSKEKLSEYNAVNLVLNGSGVFEKNGAKYEIYRGDLFFIFFLQHDILLIANYFLCLLLCA